VWKLPVGLDTQGMTGAAGLSGGGITYDPQGRLDFLAEGQTGTDTFRYVMSDGNGGTDAAEVAITVVGRNDAPVAGEQDKFTVEEGVTSIALDVLANDDDVDSDDDWVR
jgi:VCBS repeat-containing protein